METVLSNSLSAWINLLSCCLNYESLICVIVVASKVYQLGFGEYAVDYLAG